MRIAIKRVTEWMHVSLIMAMILPILYSFEAEQPDPIGQYLHVKCLIIILPVAATDFVVSKCKSLLSYLFFSVLIFAATVALGWTVAGSLHQNILLEGYIVVIICETLFIIISRMVDRLQRDSDDDISKRTDPSWRPSSENLRSPSFAVLIYFLAIYILAVNLYNPAVCNAALFSAVVYTVITALHQYICETEKYLSRNRRTCNIPSKRIYGIGTGMLAIFLLLFFIVILPALFTVSNRHYRDLRKSTALINIDFTELMQENYQKAQTARDMGEILRRQYGDPGPAPPWLDTLFYIMEAIVFIVIVAALIKMIYDAFRAFRETSDENGDIVEELESTDEGIRIKKLRINRRKLSERERIRKEYRRFIKRHRKERPARYETPTEIEKNAGIADDEECMALHKQYEIARYGQEKYL